MDRKVIAFLAVVTVAMAAVPLRKSMDSLWKTCSEHIERRNRRRLVPRDEEENDDVNEDGGEGIEIGDFYRTADGSPPRLTLLRNRPSSTGRAVGLAIALDWNVIASDVSDGGSSVSSGSSGW